ncbi:MAG: carboxylesterase [Porticoccaceae bacterium]|nr:carboxylesterase [Porticoccaceae bacterium]
MSDNLLPSLEVNRGAEDPDASVIWLHGLGASGHDFEPLVPILDLPAELSIRFIFPHAPPIPVTVNGGYVMPAWYDILSMDIDRKLDHHQLSASAALVAALIRREIERGIDSQRIVLAGFSQGGAVAYETALTFPLPLAGLLAMSTYFATADTVQPHPANVALPIHIMHGVSDPVVPETLGRRAVDQLRALGHSVEYSSYAMEHEVCVEQLKDIAAALKLWLKRGD